MHILKANNPEYEDIVATDGMRTLARLKAVIDPLEIEVGQSFMREDIPALFGEQFNQGCAQGGRRFDTFHFYLRAQLGE